MRVSKTKPKILKILEKCNYPIDAIYLTKKLNVNKTTIYREIENLLKEDKLLKVDFGDGKKRYEFKKNHHHHLVCKGCGKIENIQFNEETLFKNIKSQTKFNIKDHNIEFFGICPTCI